MSFILAHLSDAHIGPIPRPNFSQLLNKRLTGYMNWLYKRANQHAMSVLIDIVDDLKSQGPDHILMTGDIVNIGLPAELQIAEEWLLSLGSPNLVSFTPGNHDAYVAGVTKLIEDNFAPWTTTDETVPGFPYLRRRDKLALIGLNSGVPTAPFVASGRLGPQQLERLSEQLARMKQEGLIRVIFLHHPPNVGGASLLRGLEDAVAFEEVIERQGAELILHGHNHRPSVAYIRGPSKAVPVVGVASASARQEGHRPSASYHIYRFSHVDKELKINVLRRGLNNKGEITELANFDI